MKLFSIIIVLIFGILSPVFIHNHVPAANPSTTLPVLPIGKLNNVSTKNKLSVTGWYPNWDKDRAMHSFAKNIDTFDEVSPCWYTLNSDGSLNKIDSDAKLTKLSKRHHIKIIPMITNNFNGSEISSIINNKILRKTHINRIVHEVQANHYDGIELDYEGLLAPDRHSFNVFVKELASLLHRRNKILAVTLMAKTSEPGENSTGKAQDWNVLSHYADRMRIMAYDKHWKTSGPGPIAPYSWVKQVVKLAAKEMPGNKIVLGIGTYGYHWGGGRASAVDFQNIKRSNYSRDPSSKELHTSDRLTWLQDSGSLKIKVKLVKDYKLRGISLWRLGGEDPHSWDVIRAAQKR
jgi:spore germination protein